MIARIQGYRGLIDYVALHMDERTRDVWVPIRGDRGRSGEQDEWTAVRMCVTDIQDQIAPLVDIAKRLYKLCDIRGRDPTADEQSQIHRLAYNLTDTLDLAGANVSRLLDEPDTDDNIDMDAAYEVSQSS